MNRILKFAVNVHKAHSSCHKMCLTNFKLNSRTISICNMDLQKQQQNNTGDVSQQKKKTKPVAKITLIGHNHDMTITSLEEAQKIAKRRDLQLIKIQQMDTKTQRPVYKLIKAADLMSDDLQELNAAAKTKDISQDSKLLKSEKSLTVGARISENDLSSRLKNIGKWLAKNHEVRILIQGNNNEITACEKIFQTIEKFIKEPEVIGKVVNKHTKGTNVKFNIMPVLKTSTSHELNTPKKNEAPVVRADGHVGQHHV